MRIERMTDSAIAEALGAAIRAHRLNRNISQSDLANEIGVSIPTLANLEKGSAKLEVLIAAMRTLRMLNKLEQLIELPLPSPREAVLNTRPKRLKAAPSRVGKADTGIEPNG